MNILIVDDDAYVVEIIQAKIDWHKLGIHNVYTAHSVRAAKKILESVMIHIIISDIEMPVEDGFILLKWVREKGLITQNILLTSYAEFEYATKAIELQSFAYTLKPIAYNELEAIITKAVQNEIEALKAVDYEKYYGYWTATEKTRKDSFWNRLLIERSLTTEADIEQESKRLDLSYTSDTEFICMLLELYQCDERIAELGEGLFDWTLKNITEELLGDAGYHTEGSWHYNRQSWIFILTKPGRSMDNGVLKRTGRQIIDNFNTYFDTGVICLLSNPCKARQMTETFDRITETAANHVTARNHVICLDEYKEEAIAYTPPQFTVWETLFNKNNCDRLLEEIDTYLDHLVHTKQINGEVLQQFVLDYLQMCFFILKQKNIMIHSIEYEQFSNQAASEAVRSVAHARKYFQEVTMYVLKQLQGKDKKDQSPLEVIKEYIDQNLDKELTRESLAELVYLHPDYLARSFKKENGESLGVYIQKRRIEATKEYLQRTDIPVNSIAQKVGYDNFSYFSKVFKDAVGMSPKEYRKRYC